ncbi:PDZ domain-containing protein [Gordoniibacillus kamchatkensis]|uniref:PDZ domain-containing protein n=1 Tax=Gordoniibacillus kamchatkensis TaxID=1590651 RepID=UPI001E5140C8|nr:PDZ domain-containing protein [Paenibacillus sp. VKM B-2647]
MDFHLFAVPDRFAEVALSSSPRDKARRSSVWLACYGLTILLLALAVRFWSPLAFIASLLCIVLHETIMWYSRHVEMKRMPLYVHDERGLKVLAVLPRSAAAELGIVPGEIIHKVNGMPVRQRADLHQALRLNSAFSKLEVINLQGEIKFLSRPLFAGEHHQLGLVLAPDEQALYYVEAREPSLFGYLSRRLVGLARNPSLPGAAGAVPAEQSKDLS